MKKIIKGLIISALILLFVFLSIMLIICNENLSDYSNSIMIILTAAYGITTIAIWVANYHSANASKAQLEESKRQYEETKRLQIMPYFRVEFEKWIPTHHENEIIPHYCLKLSNILQKEDEIIGHCSIKVTNIGMGMAIDPICKSNQEDTMETILLAKTILKCDDYDVWDFLIYSGKNEINTEIKRSLRFEFDDFYGNHYYQDLYIVFFVEKYNIKINSYKMQVPKFIDKLEEAENV